MLQSISLNSYWKFRTDREDAGLGKNWNNHVPEHTEEIQVPSCWNEMKEDMLHYDGVAWYFKEFFFKKDSSKRCTLFFHGVNYKCDIWLNGSVAGSHTGGFTPFELDITSLLNDGNNLLAVRVDSRIGKYTIPPAGVDWFNYGGIYRDVCLNMTGESWIEDVTVKTFMDGRVEIALQAGNFKSSEPFTASISIADRVRGEFLFSAEKCLRSPREIYDIKLEDPKLWSPQSPFLYDFKIELHKNGRAMDTWEHRIGVRELSIKDRKVLLNGKPILLRGYSKHEEYPMLGRTFSCDLAKKDYDMLRRGNCNFLRLCHYPHHLKEYEIASETGFLVIAEVPNLNFTKEYFAMKEIQDNSINQLMEMIKYYKNETCIAFWSLFIECRTDEAESIDFVKSYINMTKQLDPTRITIHASVHPVEDKTYDYFDVVGVNYWSGWYNGETIEEGGRMLDRIAMRYPDKPIIITSGGWEGIPGFHSFKTRTKWSEEDQADYLHDLTEMYQSKEYIAGEIVWTFHDFRTMPWIDEQKEWQRGFWVIRPMEMNFKGVVDMYRRPKQAYYTLQETFKE